MSTETPCHHHPEVSAKYTCFICQQRICDDCVCTLDDGAIVCPSCATPEPLTGTPPAQTIPNPTGNGYELVAAPSTIELAPVLVRFGPCKNHPESAAIALCQSCSAPVCATCDFPFGDIHLCPACATNPKQVLTPKRKALAYWSIGLGTVNFLGSLGLIAITLLAESNDQESPVLQLLGCFVILCLISAAIGLVLGITSFNRRSHNPGFLWIGPIFNGLIGLVWLGLMVLGMMRSM